MRAFAIGLLALVSLVISSGCCCCGGGGGWGCGYRHGCGFRRGCGGCYTSSPCNSCDPCGGGGYGVGGYGGTYAPAGAPVIGPQQGTMLTPTSATGAYIPPANQISAVPLESLPTY